MNSLATIHIGQKELGLDEDTYRALLVRVTGKASAAKMSEGERQKVVAEMKRLGFVVRSKRWGGAKATHRKASEKAWVRLMYALWRSIGEHGGIKDKSAEALRAFVKERTGVADPEWLTYAQADPLIRALKAMEARAKGAAA